MGKHICLQSKNIFALIEMLYNILEVWYDDITEEISKD